VKRVFLFFLLKADFAMKILDFISHVHLASFVIRLPKYLTYCTFFYGFLPSMIFNLLTPNDP